MGIFDKIKNLFYDEEEIEVTVDDDIDDMPKNLRKTSKNDTVKIEQDKEINNINNNQNNIDNNFNDIVSERELVASNQNFKFPIIFEDEDIAKIEKKEEQKEQKKEEEQAQKAKYQKPVLDRKVIDEVVKKPKKFKPTPIISPIYGIIDKNYEAGSGKGSNSGSSSLKEKERELNFDTIRKKAYGTLTDDLENELSKNEEKIDEIENKIDNILEENNLLSDLKEDKNNASTSNDNLYNYKDFGVEYKIDSSSNYSDEKSDNIKSKNKKDKEVELTEDLFNLIDSMYDK